MFDKIFCFGKTKGKAKWNFDSIIDVVVDPKIRRVRFSADGMLYICRNLYTRNVKKTWVKPKSIVDLYDYTEPSLIDTLEKYGMAVEYIRM